jgi:hypothetical protein
MYRVSPQLPLQRFVDDALDQISLGQHQIQFRFGRAGIIAVEGHWQLHDASGALVDEAQDHASRQHYRIHAILGQRVTAYSIDAPRSFSITFSTGHRLTIYDDSEQYESFSIQPDGIHV